MIELERTKELAKKYKMNLREVNDKAGLGTNSIYNWKNKRPGGDALEAVAEVLNTSIDYLKGKTDDTCKRTTSFYSTRRRKALFISWLQRS